MAKSSLDNRLDAIKDHRKADALRHIREAVTEMIMSADEDDTEFWRCAIQIENSIQFMLDEGL